MGLFSLSSNYFFLSHLEDIRPDALTDLTSLESGQDFLRGM